MTRNTQKDWKKVASRPMFNLYQSTTEAHRYQVRLKASGNYIRRRFNAMDLVDALEQAPAIAGLEAPKVDRNVFTLADALKLTLDSTNRGPRSRLDWVRTLERFLRWLQKENPNCTHWALMTRQTLRDYLNTYDGKAANTKRLAMQPLLQTAGYMHREYGFPNIGERLGIGSKLKSPPKSVYLEDVLSFVKFLEAKQSHVEVGVALQGLAGLQLQEGLRLTWDKVDLERGFIEISGEIKNEYRNRVIPVSGYVVRSLKRAKTRLQNLSKDSKVQVIRQHVVTGHNGFGFDDPCSYSRQVRKELKAWNSKIDWTTKDLRNCLPTFAKFEGIHGTIWEQYIGHAPRTVTERHYFPRLGTRSSGEENALLRAMDLFKRFVVNPIDEEAKRIEERTYNNLQVSTNDA